MIKARKSWNAIGSLLVLTVAIISISCSTAEPEIPRGQTPDFILPDTNGADWQLSTFGGKVVMLHFFAPWCGVCETEVVELNEIVDRYGAHAKVELVAIATGAESRDQIDDFIRDHDLRMKVLIDNSVVSRGYNIDGFPVTFLIEKSGYINDRIDGFIESDDANSKIADLIAQES